MTSSSRSKIYKDVNYAFPNKGFCTSQNLHFYSYKTHPLFYTFDLNPASIHHIHYLKDIQMQLSDCVLLKVKDICHKVFN